MSIIKCFVCLIHTAFAYHFIHANPVPEIFDFFFNTNQIFHKTYMLLVMRTKGFYSGISLIFSIRYKVNSLQILFPGIVITMSHEILITSGLLIYCSRHNKLFYCRLSIHNNCRSDCSNNPQDLFPLKAQSFQGCLI